MLRVLALVAARRGSKGLRDKNIREVGGQPLLARAIALALAARRRGEAWSVVVSTDSPAYAELARGAGAEVPFVRPARLARDATPLRLAVLHALDELQAAGRQFDVVLLLSATTPLTSVADVRAVVAAWRRHARAVISVTADRVPEAWRLRVRRGRLVASAAAAIGRRQHGRPRFVLNGALYAASPAWLRRHRRFFVSGQTLPHVMPAERSLDIESEHDLRIARGLLGAE